MDKKRFLILIEDDFEVRGNGLGNVADLQYLPALALMNIADKYSVKLTFMVDVAQQLAFREHLGVSDIRIQSMLWDETVLMMNERGYDVQLHIHPQWLNSKYVDGHFFLSDDWNIGRYSPEEQHHLIENSVSYLTDLLGSRSTSYRVCAYKGGSWGLQPSANLLSEFKKVGINIVMGVRDDMKIDGQGIDYSGLEEKYYPYYPNPENITKMADEPDGMVVIPLQPYDASWTTFASYLVKQVAAKYRYRNNLPFYHTHAIPDEVSGLNPLKGKKLLTMSMRPYHTHLKLGNQPFPYLKKSFDSVIKRLRNCESERIPVLIESHTKQYHNYYQDVERFIAYIAEEYESELEFGDMIGFSRELIDNPDLARSKNDNH